MSKVIQISDSTYDTLSELKHPGQSFDGVILELIQKVEAKKEIAESIIK